MKEKNFTKRLVESSLMIALATVLSILKLGEMPYGGSITLASMLPIMIVAYRHGVPMGLSAGLGYAVIQQLLGLKNLSYFTTWQSIVAVILLDYIVAFTVAGLGGAFRGKLMPRGTGVAQRQSVELGMGAVVVSALRYILHTVSGCTVWAGLSIPTEAALLYSLVYNATYMIPESIILISVSIWLGGMIDFTYGVPRRLQAKQSTTVSVLDYTPHFAAFLALVAIVADTAMIFPYLQDAESGEFTLNALGGVCWPAVIAVTAVCVILSAAALILRFVFRTKARESAS